MLLLEMEEPPSFIVYKRIINRIIEIIIEVNPNDINSRVDFTDENGDMWQEFPVLHPSFKQWCLSQSHWPDELNTKELQELFEKSFQV